MTYNICGDICMKNTTLCYIECKDKVLMLHRTKKQDDPNEGKWIGIGGKFEENESPEECMLREVREETGILLTDWKYRAVVTFVSDEWEGEYMHLFTAYTDTFDVAQCDEGELAWIDKEDIPSLAMWEGDRIFLDLIFREREFFSLKLSYSGNKLSGAILNGNVIA